MGEETLQDKLSLETRLKSRLFSLASKIADNDIKGFTLEMLAVVPETFWTKPASRDHHSPDERDTCGNLLHTIRVTVTVMALADAADLGPLKRDILISAAILHDVCRYGLNGSAEFTVPEHPELVSQLAYHNNLECKVSSTIFNVIESHMGKYGEKVYMPVVSMNEILHLADMANVALLEEVFKNTNEG